ncbi:MAG: DUF4097 domain-containing protein [Gammaproteobacteria bacterium]|nr:DUF4097 domain-containing protein [Gammaproteobacteria bacterium]
MKLRKILSLLVLSIVCFVLSSCTQKITLISKTNTPATEIKNINIKELTMDIEIVSTSETNVYVEYYEHDKYKLNITIENSNGTLVLKREEPQNSFTPTYNYQSGCKTVIYVPEEFAGKITAHSDTGDIKLDDVDADVLKITSTTGDIKGNDIEANEASFKSATGALSLEGSSLTNLTLKATNGSISISDTDVVEKISTSTDNGETTFNDVKAKTFELTSKNGDMLLKKVEVESILGATVTTGDINLQLVGKKELYTTKVSTQTGETSGATSGGSITITCTSTVGDVKVTYLG